MGRIGLLGGGSVAEAFVVERDFRRHNSPVWGGHVVCARAEWGSGRSLACMPIAWSFARQTRKSPWAMQNRSAGVVAPWAILATRDSADVWDAARRRRVLSTCETPLDVKTAAKALAGKGQQFSEPGPWQTSQNHAHSRRRRRGQPDWASSKSTRAPYVSARSASATRQRRDGRVARGDGVRFSKSVVVHDE